MRRTTVTMAVAACLALAATMPASAQETGHPAGIHAGSCPAPRDQVVSLWDVSASFVVDGEADAGDAVGSQAGAPVEASVTIVEIPLEDLTGAPHAIVVQASVDAQPIVCGDLGGVMLGTDELPIALAPVGSSTWSGIALLDAASDGTTSVSLYLFEGAVSGSGLVGDDDDDGDDDRDDDDNPRGDDDGDDEDGDDGEDDRGDDD